MSDLTWQQKRKRSTFFRIKHAFKNPKTREYEPRTWNELVMHMPKSTLSENLKELIKKGDIGVKLRVNEDGSSERIYEWKGSGLFVAKIKNPEVARIHIDKQTKKIVGVSVGRYISSGVGRKKRFRPYYYLTRTEKQKI